MNTAEAIDTMRSVLRCIPKRGRIMLIGSPDTGKSTMAAALASWYVEEGRVTEVVDSDVGQADVGPPGFISYGFVDRPVDRLSQVRTTASYLIGAVSPYGRFVSVVAGLSACVGWAERDGAEVIIVDTSGLVAGSAGLRLKCAKASAIQPDLVVVLSTSSSNFLARRLTDLGYPTTVIPPIEGARIRPPEERRANRAARWESFLRDARIVTVDPSGIAFQPWWAESSSPSEGVQAGTVAGIPDPVRTGLQVPCVWLGEDQGRGRLAIRFDFDGEPRFVWYSGYRLGLSDDGRVFLA